MLVLQGLRKTYDIKRSKSITALKDVSLSVAPGEFVAARGPSGCGKSTLLLVCGAMLTPDGGDIQINDINPYELPSDARAKFRASTIGFVFQNFHLVPYLNALENILLPTLSADVSDAKTKAMNLAERFGISARLRHKSSELSAGEQERGRLHSG